MFMQRRCTNNNANRMCQEICLTRLVRNLWEQHVYWTRFFIISTAHELEDLKPVTDRLLENPGDFAEMLAPFFGNKAAREFEVLFTSHLTIASELINAAKDNDVKKMEDARSRWFKNADEIVRFLVSINPCWDEEKWKSYFYSHLEMTEKEAVLRLQGDYKADIEMFDRIEKEALKMADYMSCGINRCR